jgi:hypothetical protein
MTTDTNGRAALSVLPFLRNHYSIPSISSGLYAQPYNWTANNSTYYDSAAYDEAEKIFLDSRTVAAGVQISVVSPALTTQGRLFAGFVPIDFNATVLGDLQRPTSISEMLYTYKFHEISLPDLIDESVIIPFPTIDIGSTRYRSVYFPTLQSTTDLNNSSLPDGTGYESKQTEVEAPIETMCGWPTLVLMLEGCTTDVNTPTLLVEMIVHTENLLRVRGNIVTASRAAPPNRNAMDFVAQATATADGWLQANFQTTVKALIGKGIDYAVKAMY